MPRLLVSPTWLLIIGGLFFVHPHADQSHDHHVKQGPEANGTTAGSSGNDMWSMVASMRDHTKTSSPLRPVMSASFDWNINLDDGGRYQLSWRVNYGSNKITFGLEIDTIKSNFSYGNDLFALGFSQRGQLHSSDFCLIWFDLSHRIHLQDARTSRDNLLKLVDSRSSACRLISGKRTPSAGRHADASRDVEEEYGQDGSNNSNNSNDEDDTESDLVANLGELDEREEVRARSGRVRDAGLVEILFKRPLEVCGDRRNYYAIDNGTTHMVWFTLRGPLLTLDGLNLTHMQQHQQHEKSHEALLNFESGMRRAQLIAAKAGGGHQAEESAASTHHHHHRHHRRRHHQALDIRMDKFEMPAVETTYWCRLFKLPERFESRKFHITRYEAIVEPGNERVVHHMELFNCATSDLEQRRQLDELYHSHGGWSGDCNSPRRPSSTDSCRRVILAWAMGAKPLVYPEQVGQAIGGRAYNPYVVLEVHYNNVARLDGLHDSSGLRFHYSAQLRPFDAGVLEIGLEYTDKNSIPPNMLAPLAGYCVSECTRAAMSASPPVVVSSSPEDDDDDDDDGADEGGRRSSDSDADSNSEADEATREDSSHNQPRSHGRRRRLHRRGCHQHHNRQQQQRETHRQTRMFSPKLDSDKSKNNVINDNNQNIMRLNSDGIYIFAAQMHTHLTGVASWTEHVRAGQLVGELQRDDHYSPHFQEIRRLPEPVHIRPGDALIHYCLYDTRHRSNITLGGHATTDEMCVSYLHYYPKIDLEVCKSSVETRALEAYFARLHEDERQNTSARLLELSQQNVAGAGAANSNANASVAREQLAEGETDGDSAKTRPDKPKSVGLNYHSINWSPRRARELIEFYYLAPLSVQCNRSDGTRWPGEWRGIEPTRLVKWPGREGRARRAESTSSQQQPVAGDRIPADEEKDDLRREDEEEEGDNYAPSDLEFPSTNQRLDAGHLIAYRGRGHARKHAQCRRRSRAARDHGA